MFYTVTGLKDSRPNIIAKTITTLRKYVPPKLVAKICNYILKYESPFIAYLVFMKNRFGRIYVPLKLVTNYVWFRRVADVLRRHVEFRESPEHRRQARLLDKMAFSEVRLCGEDVSVEKVPVEKLGLLPLRVIVKSLVPLRYNDYSKTESQYVTSLARAGYLVRVSRNGRTYYYATRQVFMEAVERLRHMWCSFRSMALGTLLDLALLQYRDGRYARHRSITRDDVLRLLNMYNAFKKLPVKIMDDDDYYIGELLTLALNHPEQITVIEDV